MVASPEYDAAALLALPGIAKDSAPEKGLLSWSRPFLVREIRKQGVDVLAVRGAHSIDEVEGVASGVIRPEYASDDASVTIREIGALGLNCFDMMRSIVARKEVDHILPVLNPTALRKLTIDKSRTAAELLAPLDLYGRKMVHVNPADDLDAVFDHLPGKEFVAKPNKGMRSQNVSVGTASDIRRALSSIETDFIVEQRLDFTPPFPSSIRGIDDVQQARLERANRLGVNKELRLYSFGEGQWHVVGRIAQPGELDFRDDKWLYVDQDTVPTELFTAGEAVLDRVESIVGTRDVNVGIDFTYTATDTDTEPRWRVMEVNAGEPQLVQLAEHETIGVTQHGMLAKQIARIATKGKDTNAT